MISKIAADKRGFTMVTLIFLTVTMAVAITTGWTVMQASNNSYAGIEEEKALEVAQAGLDTAIKYVQSSMLSNTDWTAASGTYNPSGSLTGSIEGGSFTVTFTNAETDRVTVRCVGTVGGATRTVTRGLARVAEGSNYAVYCSDSNSGISIQNLSFIKGNIYTNTAIAYSGGTDTTPIKGAVYHKTGITVTSGTPRRPLDWHTDVNPAYPVSGSDAISKWRSKWSVFWHIMDDDHEHYTEMSEHTYWGPGTRTYATGSNYECDDLTLSNAGDTIIQTTGTGNPVNFYISNDLTLSNGARLVIAAGARVNFIVKEHIHVNTGCSIIQQSTYPTYFWVGHDDEFDGTFYMSGTSILQGTRLRIMCRYFNQTGTCDASTRYPGSGEVTIYVRDAFYIPSPPQQVAANIILDADSYSVTLDLTQTSRIWGTIYCYDDGYHGAYVTTNNSSGIYGSVIANNIQSANCLTTYSSSFVAESTSRWRPPAVQIATGEPYMPAELGLNPMNTGGYAVWQEP